MYYPRMHGTQHNEQYKQRKELNIMRNGHDTIDRIGERLARQAGKAGKRGQARQADKQANKDLQSARNEYIIR